MIEQFVDPDFETLEDALARAQGRGEVLTIFAECSVEWAGNRDGSIGRGERVILCKPDGAISVHRPSGARAIARQGIDSQVELYPVDDGILLYGGKSKGKNTIHIKIQNVSLAVLYAADDAVEPEHRDTEQEMHEFIESNPEALESGLRILHHEYGIEVGVIDFVCADEDGNTVVVEVKNRYATLKHVDQLNRYVTHVSRSRDAMVRGMLVAPGFGLKAERALCENDFERCELDEFESQDLGPAQSSFDQWA